MYKKNLQLSKRDAKSNNLTGKLPFYFSKCEFTSRYKAMSRLLTRDKILTTNGELFNKVSQKLKNHRADWRMVSCIDQNESYLFLTEIKKC